MSPAVRGARPTGACHLSSAVRCHLETTVMRRRGETGSHEVKTSGTARRLGRPMGEPERIETSRETRRHGGIASLREEIHRWTSARKSPPAEKDEELESFGRY